MNEPLTPLERKVAKADLKSYLAEAETYQRHALRAALELTRNLTEMGNRLEMARIEAGLLLEDAQQETMNFASSVTRATTPDARLRINPNVSSTSPEIRNTGLTVAEVVKQVVAGHTSLDILAAYPEIAEDDLRACISYEVDRQLALPDEEFAAPYSPDGPAIDPRIVPGTTVRVTGDLWPKLAGSDRVVAAVHPHAVSIETGDTNTWVCPDQVEFVAPPAASFQRIADRPEAVRPYEPDMSKGTLPGECEGLDDDDRLAHLDRELTDDEITEAALYAVHDDIRHGTRHVLDPIRAADAKARKLKAVIVGEAS